MNDVKKRLERWEVRYHHDRDMRDSQCIANGLPIPNNDPPGGLILIKNLWARYNGPRFWAAFTKKGHTSTELSKCICWTLKEE